MCIFIFSILVLVLIIFFSLWYFEDKYIYSKSEPKREIKIELLINAQEMIESEQQHYICHALKAQYLYDYDGKTGTCINELVELIRDAIYPYESIEGYLREQHSLSLTGEERIKYRSMFIDKMIEYVADNEKN